MTASWVMSACTTSASLAVTPMMIAVLLNPAVMINVYILAPRILVVQMLHALSRIIGLLVHVSMAWFQVPQPRLGVFVPHHKNVQKTVIVLMVWPVSRQYAVHCVLMIRAAFPMSVAKMVFANPCVDVMMTVGTAKSVWVFLVWPVAVQIKDAQTTCPVLTNNVLIPAQMHAPVVPTLNVMSSITKRSVHVLKDWWVTPRCRANLPSLCAKPTATANRINFVMEVAVKADAEMTRTAWLMRNACVALAAQFVIQTPPVRKDKFVKIVFAKLAAVMI